MPRKLGSYRPPRLGSARDDYERAEERKRDKRFYSSAAWRSLRARKLAADPLCVDCLKENRYVAAEHVHHLQERKARPDLALEWANLESVCQPHHNAKRTAASVG